MIAGALIAIAALIALIAHTARRQRIEDRRWREERMRLEAYGEHLAAHNGQPDGDIVAIIPTTRPRRPADRPAGTPPDPPLTPEQMQGRIGY